ncbi:calcineurin-like metallo-phosphoesterase superfamily protein isoform X2 [Wolffia australiana]
MFQRWVAQSSHLPPSTAPNLHSQTLIPSPVFVPSSVSAVSWPDSRPAMSRRVRIVVVGDVHDDWDSEKDAKALHFLGADLVLFTGDFGNENVELVKNIAELNLPKAAILGNHDCWRTYQFSRRKTDRVHLQLACLGEHHVGYRCLDFPLLNLSIVGGRPFSAGGKRFFREKLLLERYGVNDMESSAWKIFNAAMAAPPHHALIFLAHNGPKGLGKRPDDICGVDWIPGGGDHGDPADLKRRAGRAIRLVVFGHMHKELAGGAGERKMIVVSDDGEVYLNGALVPRVRAEMRGFTVVEMIDDRPRKITETWVNVGGDDEQPRIAEERVIFECL